MADKAFISHAAADAPLISELVEQLVILGSGISENKIFYTSRAATGVPAGFDFRQYIRDEVAEAKIVVAVITPSFLASGFCMSEVGAAWVLAHDFFPLAVPTLDRAELTGVLPGLHVPRMDEDGALDSLNERLCSAMGVTPKASQWGPRKATFEAMLDDLAVELPGARTVPVERFEDVHEDLVAAQEALRQATQERRELKERLDAAMQAETPEERRDAALPADERARFDTLLDDAKGKVREVSSAVALVIWAELAKGDLSKPSQYEDEYLLERLDLEIDAGHLREHDGSITSNRDYPDVEEAAQAVMDLDAFLGSSSPDFENWFKDTYRMPPRLDHKEVWDELIGRG